MRNLQLLSVLMLGSAVFAGAQESQRPTPKPGEVDTKAAEKNKNTDAVYGRIKTVTTGDKIVIAVDNAPDKTYSLRDPKVTVRVAEGLAVGAPVKVLEAEVKGNRSVDIVRNTDGEQRSRSAEDKKKR